MANYYVDSSAGVDGDGSIGRPWNNIDGHVGDLSAGDVMYLRGGGTVGTRRDYTETISITSGNGCTAGSSGNEIIVTNYADEYVRVLSGSSSPLFMVELAYWSIVGQSVSDVSATGDDMYFEMDRQDVSSGGYAVFCDGGDNLTLEYLHIHNGDYNPALVRFHEASNILVEYCRIHDNAPDPGSDHHAVYISTTGTNAISNIVIQYCYLYDAAGDCVQIQNTSGAGYISGVEILDSYLYTTLGGASENAVDDKDGDGTAIRRCKMYGFRDCDGSIGGSGADGQAILFQDDSQNGVIDDCEIYDIAGAAARIDVSGVEIYRTRVHSLVYDSNVGERTIWYITGGGSAEIYNCTVSGDFGDPVQTSDRSIRVLSGGSLTLRNCIFYNAGDVLNAGSVNADYNCWYGAFDSFAGANDENSDPQFVDAPNDDYNLTSGSPMIDAGTLWGGLAYNGAGLDIGAIEYDEGDPGTGPSVGATWVLVRN